MHLSFLVQGNEWQSAGDAASKIKRTLQEVGFPAEVVRRAAIIAYEAEMNIVIHANQGIINVEIEPDQVEFRISDQGPGIPDVELAMQEGFSTAPLHIKEMGLGAGMGLPNMKKAASKLVIESIVGIGTTVYAVVR